MSDPAFPLVQTLPAAHPLGCHHVCAARNGLYAASVGFGCEIKIWACGESGVWREDVQFQPVAEDTGGARAVTTKGKKSKIETWAIALGNDGQFLIGTHVDGRVSVWDLIAEGGVKKVRQWETRGRFGLCVDISREGKYTASGHEDGGVFLYNNTLGKMDYSLDGKEYNPRYPRGRDLQDHSKRGN